MAISYTCNRLVIFCMVTGYSLLLQPDVKLYKYLHLVMEYHLTLKEPITAAADDIHKYFFIVFERI